MILAVLGPASAVVAYDVVEAREREIVRAHEQGQKLAQSIQGDLERVISHAEGMLDMLTRIPEVRNMTAPACSSLMADLIQSQPRYAIILATDLTGTAVCASNPKGVGVSVADRLWFQRALQSTGFTIGDYIIGRVTGRPALGFALPILSPDNRMTGIAYTSIDLGWFGEHDAAASMPPDASFTLIDQNGLVMAHYPNGPAWVGKSVADHPVFAAFHGIERSSDQMLPDFNGNETFTHLLKIQRGARSAPIYLAVNLQIANVMRSIDDDSVRKVALLLLIAAGIALVTYVMSMRLITRPVQLLLDQSTRIASGDLSARSGLANDKGEIGTLAASLDSMAQSLEQQQRLLLEQQRYMRAVIDNTSELILGFDNDGRLTFMNATAKALGLPDTEFTTYKDLIAFNDAIFDSAMNPLPFEQVPLARVMNGERVINAEVLARIRKGEPIRTMLVNGQPILDERGDRLGIVIAVRDVTDLRGAEASLRQAQKMEAVGQLTGGIAHDFNNLLGVVIGNLDMLLPHLKEPGDRDLANEAIGGALRGAKLTRQMLAFARRQALTPVMLDLGRHIGEITTMLRRTLGETISISNHCASNLWSCLVDPGQLDNVLLNLAINARDAMPNGGNLTIETANAHLDEQYAASNAEVKPGDYVRISVTDNGIGIAPDILGRVLEPFFTTKAPGQGTGLGLSMAFGFAKQSGGHLKIYSEPGHGTTVSIYLPRAEAVSASAVEAVLPGNGLPRGSETVLLVDDNDAVRKTAMRQLEDLGYQVIEAKNAAAALAVLSQGVRVDLLFSDVIMPGGMNGFDLAAEASARHPGVKLLLVTGFAEGAARNGMPQGLDVELMSKPYRLRELAERVRTILDRGG
ncbi:ATP-binding protein [Dongia sp.]|uniref:ATP-binding protein n=1 Tax=Dongia sp. TaxID=1977262 RepID=UPI0035B4F2EB